MKTAEKTFNVLQENIEKLDTNANFIHIIEDDAENLKNFLGMKVTERMVNTLVLNVESERIDVYTNEYFSNNARTQPIKIGTTIQTRFRSIKKGRKFSFFPNKMRNLNGFHLTVSAFHFPPKVSTLFSTNQNFDWRLVEPRSFTNS